MKEKYRWFTPITLIGCVLLLSGVISVVLGYGGDMKGFIANLSVELLSMGITVLVIDTLYRRQGKKQEDEKEKLMFVSRLGSTENSIAKQAARDLREKNWLKLPKILLWKANLESAELYEFDLTGANLTYANLKNANLNMATLDRVELVQGESGSLEGAHLHRASLVEAHICSEKPDHLIFKNANFFETDLSGAKFLGIFDGIMTESFHPHLQAAYLLRGSIMPDGKRYDGRYNLQGDIADALAQGVDINNRDLMTKFYEISLEEYSEGQEWHKKFGKSPADLVAWA